MPLRLHCVFNNPAVLPELVKVVQKTAHKLNSLKRSAKIEDVYNELRDNNYEVDAETVAYAYMNTTGIMNRKGFSTSSEVNRFGGEGIRQAIEIANKGDLKKQKLGKYSLNTSVANSVSNTFATLMNQQDVDTSRLKELQDKLRKYAQSLLKKDAFVSNATPPTFKDVLEKVFDVEDLGLTNTESMRGKIRGSLSTMDSIWNAVKDDIDTVANGIKDKAKRAKFEQMVSEIRRSNYDMLLSSSEADKVIRDVLKSAGFTKPVNSKGKTIDVIDWNQVLASKADWKDTFRNVLAQNGFSANQSDRILDKLEGNYNRLIQTQMANTLAKISTAQNPTKKAPLSIDALGRMVRYRNAGLFAPANKQLLREALGMEIPQEVADEVAHIIEDYEANMVRTGNVVGRPMEEISHIYIEEVVRRIQNLLSPFDRGTAEKVIDGLNDWVSLRGASMIVTGLNSIQNTLSGMMEAFIQSVATMPVTGLRGFTREMGMWWSALHDVAKGGVTLREGKTVNNLEQLQGRGGLSDRWTRDNMLFTDTNAEFMGAKVKAIVNLFPQIFATAIDTANGTPMYNSLMVESAKRVLKAKGLTGKEANDAINDILFGTDPATGESYRKAWVNLAKQRLENQEGLVNRDDKAKRIADEIQWYRLVTDYGVSIGDVKAIQSASLKQMHVNLGHQSDVPSPSMAIQATVGFFRERGEKAKNSNDLPQYLMYKTISDLLRMVNMFVGGQVNWAILNLQRTPVGMGFTAADMIWQEVTTGFNAPYRAKLTLDNENRDVLERQLISQLRVSARMKRSVLGTAMMGIGYAIVRAAAGTDDDDDDRKKWITDNFTAMMQDPTTKRLMDKVAPAMFGAELSYAWDKKKEQFNPDRLGNVWIWPPHLDVTQPVRFVEYVKEQVWAKNGWETLQERLGWADRVKDKEERQRRKGEEVASYIGGIFQVPYLAWYSMETKEFKLVERGFEPDAKQAALQKIEWKQHVENLDGAADALLKGIATYGVVEQFQDIKPVAETSLPESYNYFAQRGAKVPKVQGIDSYKAPKQDEAHPEGRMTEDEYVRFSEAKQQYISETLDKIYEAKKVKFKTPSGKKKSIDLEDLTPEQLEKMMTKVASASTEKAKQKVYGKKAKAASEGSIIIE